jgi:hypothetical protein
MSNQISEDCSSNLHEYCTPCECPCHERPLKAELLDLITLMPDTQTQEIIDYIMDLRRIRKVRDDNKG